MVDVAVEAPYSRQVSVQPVVVVLVVTSCVSPQYQALGSQHGVSSYTRKKPLGWEGGVLTRIM